MSTAPRPRPDDIEDCAKACDDVIEAGREYRLSKSGKHRLSKSGKVVRDVRTPPASQVDREGS